MNVKPQFESDRLILSKVNITDWPELLSAVSSKRFPTQLRLSRIKNEEQANAWLAERTHDWSKGVGYVWSIKCKNKDTNNGNTIGQISLLSRAHSFALAYWLHPKERSRIKLNI